MRVASGASIVLVEEPWGGTTILILMCARHGVRREVRACGNHLNTGEAVARTDFMRNTGIAGLRGGPAGYRTSASYVISMLIHHSSALAPGQFLSDS
jgi:hypothetical protein